MKDKKKIIVPLLLAGVTATGVVANVAEQHIQVQAETAEITNVVGAELKVSRFRNEELQYADSFRDLIGPDYNYKFLEEEISSHMKVLAKRSPIDDYRVEKYK